MADMQVDVIFFSDDAISLGWTLGKVHHCEKNLSALTDRVEELIASSTAEWVLFWDSASGVADEVLISQLAEMPMDVFHAGLKFGLQGLPDALNYVYPTWMYNIDGSPEVAHTNFRMSFSACMIRLSVLRRLGNVDDAYSSWDMAGLAYGYSILKEGGIIRYHPELVNNHHSLSATLPLRDEWIFARRFFTKRWQAWMLLNKSGLLSGLKHWWTTGGITYKKRKPSLHVSHKTPAVVTPATVSILAPTLDRYPYLEEELRELNEQTILPHEILITDQTDKDKRQQIDFSKYNNLTIKYYPQYEKGQCLAWNKLIEEATGEYIFFFGDDAYDIKPDLIEKMLQTMQLFDADMVASNVREKGIVYDKINYHYYLSDSFPITLIKKSVVTKAGGMDMFFNRNVKADHDLAMRCHLNGALMIFDTSAEIGHHRAPSGGLRAHNARVVTNFMTKNSLTKILNPTASEIFIYKRYYKRKQYRNHIRIKYMNQVLINGNIFRRLLRVAVMIYKIPFMIKGYNTNLNVALAEMKKRGIKEQ